MVGQLTRLFRTLRSVGKMEQIGDLHNERIWQTWLANTKQTNDQWKQVKSYSAVVSRHYPRYLRCLKEQDRLHMQTYALAPLPHDFLHQFPGASMLAAQQARRKAQSDVLTPLYPVLRQLVRFRSPCC
jgi:hypothetical protein